jgi:hypothetical protein
MDSEQRKASALHLTTKSPRDVFLLALLLVGCDALFLAWRGRPQNQVALGAALIAIAALTLPPLAHRADERGVLRAVLARLTSGEGYWTLAIFTVFLTLYAITSPLDTPYNEQVRQAVAFLHGHTYIDAPSTFLEHAQVGPYSYALHPPLPAILLMPLVAIWGMETNQAAFCVVVGAADVALAWRLLGRFRLDLNARIWLTIFFGAGTILWYETIVGTTWALPIVVSVFFTLATLIEAFGSARPLWLGVFAGLASLARYDLAFAAPIYAALAYLKGRTLRELLWMAPGFALVGVVFVGLNEARYQSFFDLGIALTGPKHAPAFAAHYLPGNLYTVFFMAPTVDGRFPYIHPIFVGQALTLTSPAFVLALRASFRRVVPVLMGLAAIVVSIPSLLCYANGFAQFGTRHYLQAFPFLLVMMAVGTHRRADQLTRILIITSVILIAFGVWHIRLYGFG